MRSVLIIIVAALAMTITASAQSPDPAEILRRADSACSQVRSVRYAATIYKGDSRKPEYSAKADISFRRMKDWGDIGGAVRIELMHVSNASNKMGTIYAYDGITLRRLSPSSKEVLVAGPEQFGFSLITENWLGQLIRTPLNGDSSLKKGIVEGKKFHYEGIEEIESVSCHVISIESPAGLRVPQRRTVWYIGTDDYLPRRRVGEIVYNGIRQEDGLTLRDLEVNPGLSDSAFLISAPDGYMVANYEKFPKPLAAGTAAPAWTLFDASARPVSLSDLRGKVVLLDFWHTASDPCIMTMPIIQKLHERFRDRGMIVYGIAIPSDDSTNAIRMMQQKEYTYGLLLDGGDVANTYNYFGWPMVYLIGDDGIILFSRAGRIEEDEEKLAETIEHYLHERGR